MTLTLLAFFAATFGMVAAGVISYRFVIERQELAGTERHSSRPGIDWVEPKCKIVAHGAEAGVYFAYTEKDRRLTGLNKEMEDLICGGQRVDACGVFFSSRKPHTR